MSVVEAPYRSTITCIGDLESIITLSDDSQSEVDYLFLQFFDADLQLPVFYCAVSIFCKVNHYKVELTVTLVPMDLNTVFQSGK